MRNRHFPLPVFSLNFSSEGKGPFMVSKAKNMHQWHSFLGGGGGGLGFGGSSGVMDMALPSLGNLEAKFSEMSFPQFKTYFTRMGHCYP